MPDGLFYWGRAGSLATLSLPSTPHAVACVSVFDQPLRLSTDHHGKTSMKRELNHRSEHAIRIKSLLLATDFSPSCDDALKWATKLAGDLNAKLIILHVEQPAVLYGEVYCPDILDHHSRTLMKKLQSIKPPDPKVDFCHRLACGDPATEILNTATDEDVGMIVMNTHGRAGIARMLAGSVAESVIRRADCPVVIFKSAVK
jgi:universal stress protein A